MLDVLGAWAGLMSLIITYSHVYESQYPEDKKDRLGEVLKGTLQTGTIDWYNEVNKQFLSLFNWLFGFKETTIERLWWFGLLLTYWTFFTLRIAVVIFNIEIPETSILLSIAIGISAVTVLGVTGIFGSESVLKTLHDWDRFIPRASNDLVNFYVRGIFGAILLSVLSMTLILAMNRPELPLIVVLATFPALGLEFLLFANQRRNDHPIKPMGGRPVKWFCIGLIGLTVAVYNLLIFLLAQATHVTQNLVGALGVITLLVPLGVYLIFNINPDRFNSNPLRAMVLSLGTVTGVSLLVPGARNAFIESLEAQGFILLSFLAFNIFADTISLQETNWILEKSRCVSPKYLLAMLVGDLVLSGIIYLILPFFVGQLDVFFLGVQFSGPTPWVGILFWSTFITSAIFYLFFLCVIIISSGVLTGRLIIENRFIHLNHTDSPIVTIGFVASIIVTGLFVLYGIAWYPR